MRVTIPHNKSRQEAVRIVNSAVDQVFRPDLPGPLKLTAVQKNWSGSTLSFSLAASLGIIHVPIRGDIFVTDADITIDCNLLGLLGQTRAGRALLGGLESKVRGLLTG